MTRTVRIALVVYLSPVLLATFALGLIAMAIVHLASLTAAFYPHFHRVAAHRPPIVMASRLGGSRAGTPPFA